MMSRLPALALAWLLTRHRSESIDFRLVLLGAVLPDLIDKPFGFLLELQGRLWAHTLLFLLGVLALSRVSRLRALEWVGFGIATHLLLDMIWSWPWVAFWPFAGPFHASKLTVWTFVDTLLTDPVVQAGELAGVVCLAALGWACGIRSWASLRAFLRDGRLAGAHPRPRSAPQA